MTTLLRRGRGALRSLTWFKVLLGFAAACFVLGALSLTLHAQDDFGHMRWTSTLAFALLPICAMLTFRYPLICPFVIYVGLLPFAPILGLSSNGISPKLLAFATIGALLLRALLQRRALLPPPAWFAWAALIALAATSLLWVPDFDHGVYTVNSMLLLFGVMTALAVYPATFREFQIAMAGIALSGVAAAAFVLQQYHSGAVSHVEAVARLALTTSTNVMLDPNYFASSFVLPVALALCGWSVAKNPFVRLGCIVAVLGMFTACLATGSRGGFLSIAAVIIYFAVRSRHRLQALSVAALALAATAFLPNVWERLLHDPEGDNSGSGRTILWQVGMHNFKDHWLIGSGAGSYPFNYDLNLLETHQRFFQGWDRPGHSLIFVGLNDFGVLGMALVLLCWFVSFRQLRVIPQGSPLYGYRLACEGIIIGLFVEAQFIDPYYIDYLWVGHALALLVVNLHAPRMLRIGRRMERRDAPPAALQPLGMRRPLRDVRGI